MPPQMQQNIRQCDIFISDWCILDAGKLWNQDHMQFTALKDMWPSPHKNSEQCVLKSNGINNFWIVNGDGKSYSYLILHENWASLSHWALQSADDGDFRLTGSFLWLWLVAILRFVKPGPTSSTLPTWCVNVWCYTWNRKHLMLNKGFPAGRRKANSPVTPTSISEPGSLFLHVFLQNKGKELSICLQGVYFFHFFPSSLEQPWQEVIRLLVFNRKSGSCGRNVSGVHSRNFF